MTEQSRKRYPHSSLLFELQSYCRSTPGSAYPSTNTTVESRQHQTFPVDANTGGDSGSESELQNRTDKPWTLATDARLATFLHQFSQHVRRRTMEVSYAICHLEEKANHVSCNVKDVSLEFLLRSDAQFVENRVAEDEVEDHNHFNGGSGVVVPSMGTGSVLEGVSFSMDDAEEVVIEDEAIQDGMKALSIFFDPAKSGSAGGNDADQYFGMDDDTCYYYESAPDDTFNQRPLPFVVGSREFMESTDAGLGEEDEEESPAAEHKSGDGKVQVSEGMKGDGEQASVESKDS